MAGGEDPSDGSQQRTDAESDEVLARRVQRGDGEALEELVRRFVRPVHAVVAAYLPEPADASDAAQETFLRALRRIDSYDPGRPFAPWLYQIARRVSLTLIADRSRSQGDELPASLPSASPGPGQVVERSEIRGRVDAAVACLPEQQRTAFRLTDVEGYATGEVARLMGLSPGTVRSHVHHARKALRTALADSLEELRNPG